MQLVVAVTGPPASGKSTLAVPLARALNLPLLGKDVVKEALFDALGTGEYDASWSRRLSEASYRVIAALLEGVPSAVLDMNLPNEWADSFRRSGTTTLQVFCRCPGSELERRLVERATSRHPAHLDDVVLDEVRAFGVRGAEPARLGGPLLEVDTTRPVDLERVVAWVSEEATRGRA